MIKLFKYIEPVWLGTNNKVSIRRVLALVFSIDLVKNTSHIIHRVDAGKSYADVAMLLGLEAALIAALLSLTTYSAMINKKVDNQSNIQAHPPEE
jgi:hypothetical protein